MRHMNHREGKKRLIITPSTISRLVTVTDSGCWNWNGLPRNDSGYCQIRTTGKCCLAHRFVYEAIVGVIPEGLFVLHSCDNRRCVNPAHLYLGTHGDNMRDMVRRHRHRNRSKILSRNVRRGIIRAVTTENRVRREVARQFGVAVRTVYRICADEKVGAA